MTTTNILNAIPSYVLTAVVSAVLLFVVKAFHTYVHNKALTAKTAQAKQLWSFMDQVSEMAVNSLVSADQTGDEKFAAATKLVQDALNKQGFTNIDISAIEAAVQAAYEKSPLTTSEPTPAGTATAIDPSKGGK